MRILLASEWGWEEQELGSIFTDMPGVELTVIKRAEFSNPASPTQLQDYDLVLTYGPHYGRMRPLLAMLRRCPRARRPTLVWWLNENVPDLRRPMRVSCPARARLAMDALLPATSRRPLLKRLEKIGHRYRIFGEIMYSQRDGMPVLLACTSAWRAAQLQQLNYPTIHLPMGWGPSDELGVDLGLTRDIDVGWLGSLEGLRQRRGRILDQVTRELAQHGVKVTHFQDVHHHERTVLLNRTKILLNILRFPVDFTGHRLLLGAATKSMLVSEPMMDDIPFIPDMHMVQAPIPQLAQTIVNYLNDEAARLRITEAAYDLVMNKLTMRQSVQTMLEAVASSDLPAAPAVRKVLAS